VSPRLRPLRFYDQHNARLGAARIQEVAVPVAETADFFETDLADLTKVPLSELRSLDNPILTNALRRVAEEAKDADDATAGFQAAI
jgi:FXSXX-COOH protein